MFYKKGLEAKQPAGQSLLSEREASERLLRGGYAVSELDANERRSQVPLGPPLIVKTQNY